MKTYSKLILLLAITTSSAFAQNTDCIRQKKYEPENSCLPCTLDARYNVIVRNLLRVHEVEQMEHELNKMAEQADAFYKTYGNLKQHGFNELDMDLKKLLALMEKNPDKARDLISWLEGELEKAGCNRSNIFDSRSEGVADGGLQNITSDLSSVMRQLTYPNYQGPAELTFDCCEEKRWHPGDLFINNVQEIDRMFARTQRMFDNLKLLHESQMKGVQWSVWQFQKYDKSSREQMERLANNSFCNVLTNALAQSGAMSTVDADKLNQLIKKYCETNDKISTLGAARELFGDEVADALGFFLENYTATDLLSTIGDLIREQPKKFKAIQNMGSALKGAGWLLQFMNLVQIAESSVNIFFDTYMKLGGNHFVLRTQSDLWCVAATYYYYAAQSLLYNAAAIYKMKRTLHQLHRFFPKLVIPMPPTDSLGGTALGRKTISVVNSRTTTGTQRENHYEVVMPDGKKIVFVYGEFMCGKPRVQQPQKAEETPEPRNRKIAFTGGFVCGTGWISNNAVRPNFNGINSAEFVSQYQNILNDGFDGTAFVTNSAIEIKSLPVFEAGLGMGCAVNHQWELKAEVSGTWQRSQASTLLRVARIVVPDNPSQPPSTQQSTEMVQAVSSTGMFRFQSGPAFNFGERVNGYTGAGWCVGVMVSSKTHIRAGNNSFTETKPRVTPLGGGYVEAGVKFPIAERWQACVGAASQFISIHRQFAAYPQLKVALQIRY